jgi:hypothetical protein
VLQRDQKTGGVVSRFPYYLEGKSIAETKARKITKIHYAESFRVGAMAGLAKATHARRNVMQAIWSWEILGILWIYDAFGHGIRYTENLSKVFVRFRLLDVLQTPEGGSSFFFAWETADDYWNHNITNPQQGGLSKENKWENKEPWNGLTTKKAMVS